MKQLKNFFKNIGLFFLSILSRLKVFNQIMLIIFIMIGFILLEGYLGLKVIKQMQEGSNAIFTNSVNGFKTINETREELNEIRKEYLIRLGDIQPNITGATMQFNQALSLVSLLSNIDPELSASIDNDLQSAKAIFEEPVSEKNYEELEKKLALIKLSLNNMESGIFNSAADSMKFGSRYLVKSQNNTVIVFILSLLFSIILAVIVTATIANPLELIVKAVKTVTTGNLSRNFHVQGCQEAKHVVEGLNEAISGLRRLIGGINEQAELLINASKELNDASVDSGKSAAEVARTMEELAKASSEQANQINQTVNTINELGNIVRKVSTDTEKIADISGKVTDSAKLGQKVTVDVANEINELYQSTKEVAVVIDELNQTSGEISEITSVIGGIAEQTTLLALNASIEAARAGVQGKGFSVVAKETGKLAEQSKQAAQMIADLIVQMKTKTSHAVEVIQKETQRVKEGKILADKASVTFESIFKELDDILDEIERVTHSTREMAEKNESVINMVSGIATISEQSMASTQEVSATTEEQSAAAQQVSSLAGNLSEIADMLKESVAVFRIKSYDEP